MKRICCRPTVVLAEIAVTGYGRPASLLFDRATHSRGREVSHLVMLKSGRVLLFRGLLPIFLGALAAISARQASAAPALNNLAPTPPMGWDSYDSYGALATEAQIEANAAYMAANLESHGFDYITLDYCWSFPYQPGPQGQTGTSAVLDQTYNAATNTYTPTIAMDSFGRLLPDPGRFPDSIQNGVEVGLKPLIDYVHSLGLKFGLHIMRGIPRQAYTSNLPIFGSTYTAGQVTNTSDTTTWNNQMYGLNYSSPGAQAYYNSIFSMYASWGVDFIKLDDVDNPYRQSDITDVDNAITSSGRPMVVSLSPGDASTANAAGFQSGSNMWRLMSDLWDNWTRVNNDAFAAVNAWTPYRQTNSWPDADMLPLGTFIAPPNTVNSATRTSQLTHDEQRTVMTLWSIARSPLIMGGNLPSLANDAWTTSLLTNDRVLAVDQDSTNNRQIFDNGTKTVWAADIPGSPDKYVAFFNRGNSSLLESVNFTDLGLSASSYDVIDLWTGTDLGFFTNSFSTTLPMHGAGLYEVNAIAFIPEPTSATTLLLIGATALLVSRRARSIRATTRMRLRA
jgi:alpha-galactosidase